MSATCRSCGREIVWASWSDSGKWIPLDLEPSVGGNIALVGDKVHRYTAEDERLGRERRVSHFASCPNAEQHRQPRAPAPSSGRRTCTPISLGGVVTGFVCGSRAPAKACGEVGCAEPAVSLCDFPLSGKKSGKTCSKPICARHKREQPDKLPDGDSRDYCPTHDRIVKAQPKLF